MMKMIQSLISTLFRLASPSTGPASGFAGCLHTLPELSAKGIPVEPAPSGVQWITFARTVATIISADA